MAASKAIRNRVRALRGDSPVSDLHMVQAKDVMHERHLALLRSVMLHAIRDACPTGYKGVVVGDPVEARAWLFDTDPDDAPAPFTAAWIADHLDLDLSKVRTFVVEWKGFHKSYLETRKDGGRQAHLETLFLLAGQKLFGSPQVKSPIQ